MTFRNPLLKSSFVKLVFEPLQNSIVILKNIYLRYEFEVKYFFTCEFVKSLKPLLFLKLI